MDISKIAEVGNNGEFEELLDLIDVIKQGSANKKRLASITIANLTIKNGHKYWKSIPMLFNLLKDEKIPVRYYSLYALRELVKYCEYTTQQVNLIYDIKENDMCKYNKRIAARIINEINKKKNIGIADKEFNFNNIFVQIDYLIKKGNGYSIYNASDIFFQKLINEFSKKISNKFDTIRTSQIDLTQKLSKDSVLFVYQDLKLNDLLEKAEFITNKIIYPAWYQGNSIFFISKIDKCYYNVDKITSSLIHRNYKEVFKLLALEQLTNLLEQVNSTIISPELISVYNSNIMFTPIEKIFKDKLVERGLSFKSQVKLDRFYVDFLVEVNNTKVIVECDGREYHDAVRDAERDKELKKEGYSICRFSGSEIYNNCDECIDKLFIKNQQYSTNKYILEDLNDEQKIAANHVTGPMRVLAPAGSGKTKTIINRIANLVNSGVREDQILALAFNKKVEIEMNQRVSEKFGLTNVTIKTFHSFGNDLIKETLKWRFNKDKEKAATRELLEIAVKKHHKIKYKRNEDHMDKYLAMLSKVKNELTPIQDMLLEEDDQIIRFDDIFDDYMKISIENNFYNFDDMLYIAVRKLLDDSIVRRKIQNKYKYILVDEFQDLNKVQLLLLQILALPENNLFIVGDDDQMIYSFRGAEVRNILQFNSRYTITSDQVLKINYRSYKEIVKHSKWLIDNNKTRVSKDIIPFSQEKADIKLFIGQSLKEQAENTAEWILSKKNENTRWSDFAILFRYNQYKDLLNIMLSKYDIPVEFDTLKILNSGVGRTIAAYLAVICNTENSTEQNYRDILLKPNKYFTNDFIKTIKCWDDFINVNKAKVTLRKMNIEKYINFVNKIQKLRKETKGKSAGSIVNSIVEEFDLREFYKDQSKLSDDIDAASDYDILEIIISFAENFEEIDDFYYYFNNNVNKGEDKEKVDDDRVILSTIHKTKGNEYKNVVYFNLVSKVTQTVSELEMEEERRVAYVGVTRPKKSLLITTQQDEISPFVKEFFLDPNLKKFNNETLQDRIKTLDAEVNVITVNINQIEDEIDELVKKYPELKGQYIKFNKVFKNIKKKLRRKAVNEALIRYKKFNDEKNSIYNNKRNLLDQRESLKDELKYRNILEIK